jgi:hypothetical protein
MRVTIQVSVDINPEESTQCGECIHLQREYPDCGGDYAMCYIFGELHCTDLGKRSEIVERHKECVIAEYLYEDHKV